MLERMNRHKVKKGHAQKMLLKDWVTNTQKMDIYISSYGAYLHVSDEMFAIKVTIDGASKHQKVAVHKVRSIIFTTHGAVSTEAIRLALKNNIDILFLESNGQPIGRFWHSKLGSTTKIRKEQLAASLNEKGLFYTKQWLGRKLENQLVFIKDLKKHRSEKHGAYLEEKLSQISALKASILGCEASTVSGIADSLRGWEGTSGRLYFQVLSHILPKTYQFSGRSSRPAKDSFNAFLNYAYGILYSKVEKALIIGGIDPYVGFMHRDDYNQKSMVFDFIEAYRIYAERVVFRLFSAKKVNKSHTNEITNGYSLNKEGKILLVEAFMKYVDEDKIKYRNRHQTRLNAMQQDAHVFANTLIGKEIKNNLKDETIII